MSHRRPVIIAAIGTALAFILVNCFPAAEQQVFAQGAARIAGLFTGAPVVESEAGWLLPLSHRTILVSEACSGATFFLITCTLLCWHISRRTACHITSIVIGLSSAFALAIFINALRIICLVQAHRWLIPQMPDNYAGFAHMLIGIAVFLPSLIALNALFEFYGNSKDHTATRSA